jgi:hypothetical protein
MEHVPHTTFPQGIGFCIMFKGLSEVNSSKYIPKIKKSWGTVVG